MSIASDKWIMSQCMGEILYDFYTFNGTTEERRRHSLATVSERGSTGLIEQLSRMRPGEEIELPVAEGSADLRKPRVKCVHVYPDERPLISPFIAESKKHLEIDIGGNRSLVKCPSYGLSSFGYDIRVDRKFTRFKKIIEQVRAAVPEMWMFTCTQIVHALAHPYGPSPESYTEAIDADYIDIAPNEFILGVSVERIAMPRHVTATCMAKSTLARMGLDASVTPIEAGWSGYITLEIYNKSPNTIRLYAGTGIMQLIFHVADEGCLTSYADRGGKYQDQPDKPVAGSF